MLIWLLIFPHSPPPPWIPYPFGFWWLLHSKTHLSWEAILATLSPPLFCWTIQAVFLSFHQQNLQKKSILCAFIFSSFTHASLQGSGSWPHKWQQQSTKFHPIKLWFNIMNFLSVPICPCLGTYSSLAIYCSAKFCICPPPACASSQPPLWPPHLYLIY